MYLPNMESVNYGVILCFTHSMVDEVIVCVYAHMQYLCNITIPCDMPLVDRFKSLNLHYSKV